jgi:hypothetical protein
MMDLPITSSAVRAKEPILDLGRQLNVKGCSMRTARRKPQSAAMGFNDRSTNGKAHSHTMGLRRKEGIENAVDVASVNSSS